MQPAERSADVERLVAAARTRDPSIDPAAGALLARTCLTLLRDQPDLDTAELARACAAQHPDADVSWINYIAVALLGTTGSG